MEQDLKGTVLSKLEVLFLHGRTMWGWENKTILKRGISLTPLKATLAYENQTYQLFEVTWKGCSRGVVEER